MSDDAAKKTKLEIVSEEALDEDEAEFKKLRRDLPGVKGASAIGIVSIGVGKIRRKKRVLPNASGFPAGDPVSRR